MARTTDKIVADIRNFEPKHGNWLPLDDLLVELHETGKAGRHFSDLLAVLERFPEDDGAGVLWSIVHLLESLPDYEAELVRSVRRRPSELGTIMIGRLLNSGKTRIDGTSLIALLQDVAATENTPERIRTTAKNFVARQSASSD